MSPLSKMMSSKNVPFTRRTIQFMNRLPHYRQQCYDTFVHKFPIILTGTCISATIAGYYYMGMIREQRQQRIYYQHQHHQHQHY